MAILMQSMSENWALFRTDLILGKRKKSQELRSRKYGGVPKLKYFFLQETDKYSELCKQQRYHDGASMRGRYGFPMLVKARELKVKSLAPHEISA